LISAVRSSAYFTSDFIAINSAQAYLIRETEHDIFSRKHIFKYYKEK